jgi:hypothetical protein
VSFHRGAGKQRQGCQLHVGKVIIRRGLHVSRIRAGWQGCALLRQSSISDQVYSALFPFSPWTVICTHLPSLTPWFNGKTVARAYIWFLQWVNAPPSVILRTQDLVVPLTAWRGQMINWPILLKAWVPSLMNPQGFNLLLLYQCISIFLFEPVTVNKKHCESYASLPVEVKELRDAKRPPGRSSGLRHEVRRTRKKTVHN